MGIRRGPLSGYIRPTRVGNYAESKSKPLQRLFTVFPGGWPAAGLLLLRVAAAIPLLIGGSSACWGMPHDWLYARFIAIGVGLWTPIAGALQAVIQLWIVVSSGKEAVVPLLLVALGVSLAMLGPGAWSVDARLFGRKRIDIRSR